MFDTDLVRSSIAISSGGATLRLGEVGTEAVVDSIIP